MSKIKNNYLTHSLYCECGSCYNGGRKYMTEEDKNLLRYIIGLALTAIGVVLFTLIASG